MIAELVCETRNIVGESLVWDMLNNRLVWVDIVGKTIHALDPNTGAGQSWNAPDFVTSIGLRKDGGAIVGLTKELCLWDFSNSFTRLAQIELDRPENRLNEGVVGPDGAFWVGTMQNNIKPDGLPCDITANTGWLYRCTAEGQVNALTPDQFGITNTFVWTNDSHVITADTLENKVYRYRYDTKNQHLLDRQILLSGFNRGLPDGSTLDSEGFIWNCRVVGGGCVIRFDTDGQIDRILELPCTWPTSCAFGGQNLDTLYVTSARFTMEADYLEAHPHEGGLFAIKPGVTGLLPHRFG